MIEYDQRITSNEGMHTILWNIKNQITREWSTANKMLLVVSILHCCLHAS